MLLNHPVNAPSTNVCGSCCCISLCFYSCLGVGLGFSFYLSARFVRQRHVGVAVSVAGSCAAVSARVCCFSFLVLAGSA